MKFPTRRSLSLIILCCTALAAAAARAIPLPLSKVPVPEPPNLSLFVKDKSAAVRLGKAFFWDMQAGSDGVQACASCHFRAGADSRLTNQLNPGPVIPPALLPSFEVGPGPNYTLQPTDFPFFQVFPVDGRLGIDPATGAALDPNTVVVRDLNDIGGSQGIGLAAFLAINAGSAVENGTPAASPLFGRARQVTGRNAPSVINAVFNYSNFWDGRANNIFNGENPLGPLDVNAGIWIDDGAGATLVKRQIAIPNASLASQATGPPLSGVEMSFGGRTFPEVGRKLISLTPLGGQLVHPADSVLGPLARGILQPDGTLGGAPGLATSYAELIRAAFNDTLWSSVKTVTLPSGAGETTPQFTQMEANFPLFWGLALQLYQATLVSDRTPFDRFLAGNVDALSASAQNGFATFVDKCAVCHSGSELTSAVVGSTPPVCVLPDCNRLAFTNNTTNTLVRFDTDPASFALRMTDAGFFNIGVRPTADDLGRGAGGSQGFPYPLSFTKLALLTGLPFATPQLPPGTVASIPVVVDGAFKAPGLRNVELTAPYFHNGSAITLDQVLEFYTRGGNFPNNPELSGSMQPIRNLRGNATKRGEVVAFLNSLTDERVRNETAPFDHPQLFIPSGDAAESTVTLAGTGGSPPPVAPALTVAPFLSPSVARSVTFSGTVAALSTVEVRVGAGAPLFASVTGTSWSAAVANLPVGTDTVTFLATSATGATETESVAVTVLPLATIAGAPLGGKTTQSGATLTIGGAGVVSYRYSLDGAPFSAETPVATPIVLTALADATHTVAVLGRDAAGNQQPAANATTSTWIVKANPPVLTLGALVTPTRGRSQTIGGSVELGLIPTVFVDSAALTGPVSVSGGNGIASWSCTLTGLTEGGNNITVTARDVVSHTTTASGTIIVVIADGSFAGTGVVDISDALRALRIAVGLVQASAADLSHGDVAPLVNGVPSPDGRIDVSDALVILRKVVGLASF